MYHTQLKPLLASIHVLIILIFLFCGAGQSQTPDKAGCQDHPLFTRMQDMHIEYCKTVAFDRFVFKMGKANETAVEGKRFEIRYKSDLAIAPSPLQIIRNHQQAIAKIGGTTLFEDKRYTVLKVAKNGQEVWALLDTAWGKGYMLTIIEKEAMAQEVISSMEIFKTGLKTSGHIEVPGIYFDTGKSDLKPESSAAIAEIAKLLKADPALKVYVVGHTDNVASLDLNIRLSQARSEAVVQALVTQHGISVSRLIGRGAGPLAPVLSNDTEEGRAKNRRVELVKQ
jgi:OmpA-OmpF porin, OOP family